MIAIPALVLLAALPAAPAAKELTALLNDFLAGASRNDAAVHDRFWSEDLVYTGSSGRRIAKADIMKDVTSAPKAAAGEPATVFTAEEIRIQQFKDVAVVAFRLVGTTDDHGTTRVRKYYNTGTFVRRKGAWKATAWQATKIPRTEDESKGEVAAADAALRKALAAGEAVEPLVKRDFAGTVVYGDTAIVRSASPPATVVYVDQGDGWKPAIFPE